MAGVTPRNSPFSLFSGIPGPEIPRSPFRGTDFRGNSFGGVPLVAAAKVHPLGGGVACHAPQSKREVTT